jgi:hypothetical protein
MRRILLILSLALLVYPTAGAWDALKSDQFTVFYEPAYKARALRLLSDIEFYKNIPENIVGNKCYNVPFVLDDYGQYVNGLTNPIYYNIHIMNYETEDADWLSFVSLHEYTHMVHLTKAGGLPAALTFLFGNILAPDIYAPEWSFEAIAVYNESKMSKYMGRLNDGAYDSYMGICVSEGRFPSLLKASNLPLEFPYGESMYLFGSEFLDYLAKTYGEDKLKKFYDSYSSSPASYLSLLFPWLGIDRTMDETFGGTTLELWDKWQEYEKQKHRDFKQEGDRVTRHGDFTGRPSIRGDKLYYEKKIVEKTAAFESRTYDDIMEMDLKTGVSRPIISLTSGLTHPLRFSGNKMYYAVAEEKPGYANKSNLSYGIFTVIYERDLTTGREKPVLSDGIRTFFSPYDGVLIYAKDDPYAVGSEIYEYDIEKGENRLIADTDYLVLALEGNAESIYAAARRDGQNEDIYSFDRNTKKFTPIISTPYYESSPELYGDRLFFRANYGGIYSAYCYDTKKKKIYRLTDNGTAGTPAYYEAANEIYFAGTTTDGFDIFKKKAEFKEYKPPSDKPDFTLPPLIDEAKLGRGGYADNLATLVPRVRLPLLYSNGRNIAEAGLGVLGGDAIGDFSYTAAGTYNFLLNSGYYTLGISAYLLAPAVIYFNSNNYPDNDYASGRLTGGLSVPLYRSLQPGLSGIEIGCAYDAFNGLARRQINPNVSVNFNWPATELSFSAARTFEGRWLGSDYANRQAVLSTITLTQFVPDGRLRLTGTGIYDPDNNADVLPVIRGYADDVDGNIGSAWTLDYTRQLVKIRSGFWIPMCLYVEDLCGGLFVDSAFANSTQFSYGAELHLETRWLTVAGIDLGIRYALNREGHFTISYLIGTQGFNF